MTSIAIDRLAGLSSSTATKGPCRVATVGHINLAGEQTIDGIAVVEGERVLVKNQTDPIENGIYVSDTGLWQRSKDFSRNRDIQKGTQVYVTDGTGSGNYRVTSSNPVQIDIDAITFELYDLVADAAGIAFTPTGGLAATNVQDALVELDAEKLSAAQADALFLTPTEGDAAYQPLDGDLTAIAALASTGLAARTASSTWAQRTITGTVSQITVVNGNGVSGNPTLSLATDVTIRFATRALAAAHSPAVAPDFMRVEGYTSAGDGGGALFKKVGSAPSHAGKYSITLSDAVTVVWYEIAETVLNGKMFGAVSDGATNDSSALQSMLDTAASLGALASLHPGADHHVTTGLTLAAGVNFDGRRGRIKNTSSHITLLTPAGTNRIRAVRFKGAGTAGNTVYTDAGKGIYATGTFNGAGVAPTFISDLVIEDCEFDNFGGYGIDILLVDRFTIRNNRGADFGYAGFQEQNCRIGLVTENSFKDIGPGLGDTCYGMAFTRRTGVGYVTDLVRSPQTRDVLVANNVIENNTIWEGLDTHAGKNIWFVGNKLKNCALGIVATHDGTYAPQSCGIVGNHIEGRGFTSGTISGNGIVAVGNISTPDYASGILISNNHIEAHGNDNVDQSGGIYTYGTKGLRIHDNVIKKCYRAGVYIYSDSEAFSVSGNAIIDIGGITDTTPTGIEIREDFNTGHIGGNSIVRNDTAWATYVLVNGISVKNDTDNTIDFAYNNVEAATSRYVMGANIKVLAYPTVLRGKTSAAAVSTAAAIDDEAIALPMTMTDAAGAIVSCDYYSSGSSRLAIAVNNLTTTTLTTRLYTSGGGNFPVANAYTIYWEVFGY